MPISVNGNLRWVAVSSTPLGDVDDTVALIRRQILIAGGIALILALAAGWFAARAHAKRLNRLEEAAQKVAEGDFSTPIPDEGTDEVGQLAATFNEMQQRLARLDGAGRSSSQTPRTSCGRRSSPLAGSSSCSTRMSPTLPCGRSSYGRCASRSRG